jgi:hypothetical protein
MKQYVYMKLIRTIENKIELISNGIHINALGHATCQTTFSSILLCRGGSKCVKIIERSPDGEYFLFFFIE